VADSVEVALTVERVADIVAAYVSNNAIPTSELPQLIASVHGAITRLAGPVAEPEPAPLVPAVPVKKSVTPDYIVCLEDGKKFKSLKRHLRTHYDLSPEQYRAKWGLPRDYPMVAPAYAEARSKLAKSMGLGQQRKKPEPAPPEPVKATRGRGRPKAAAPAPEPVVEAKPAPKPRASRKKADA
jgi:predicted transcriptional regulator